MGTARTPGDSPRPSVTFPANFPSTSPAAKVEVLTERRARWCRRGENLTELTFDLSGYLRTSREVKEKRCMPYFRITVTDARGETAQSCPYTEETWGE